VEGGQGRARVVDAERMGSVGEGGQLVVHREKGILGVGQKGIGGLPEAPEMGGHRSEGGMAGEGGGQDLAARELQRGRRTLVLEHLQECCVF